MVSFFTNMVMEPLSYPQILMLASFFFLFLYHYTNKKILQNDLPLIGMLPKTLVNFEGFNDSITQVLVKREGTVLVKGSWLAPMDTLVTCDPANVHCIMTANFTRYVKGPEWRKRFDVLGVHNMVNTDFDEWKLHRKTLRCLLTHQRFQELIAKFVPEIIVKGLVPVLEHACKREVAVDLQDLSSRYTFDIASMVASGYNSSTLSIGLPENPFPKALDDAFDAIAIRHVVPESVWRLLRWLKVGKEKKLSDAWKTIDQCCAEQISRKREVATKEDDGGFNLLNCYLTGHEVTGPTPTEEVMRDMMTNTILAIKDTTSSTLPWFFWLISKNPLAESKIREELGRCNPSPQKEVNNCQIFDLNKLNKMVYLHAALCETLRLFPPVHIQFRKPLQPEILPSGHQVNQNTNILISAYAMARMKSIWGEDCEEFKPERWITDDGGIRHQPPHKFFAFNAGPRICLGKDMAFTVMKAITATIIHNYDIQVAESHPVTPKFSIMFRMKHGLMARVKRRSMGLII